MNVIPQSFAQPFQTGQIYAPKEYDTPQTNEQLDKMLGLSPGTIAIAIEKGSFTFQSALDVYYAEQASLNPLKFIEQQELELAQKRAKTLSPEILQALNIVESRDLRTELQDARIPGLDKRLFNLGLLTGEPAKRMKKMQESILLTRWNQLKVAIFLLFALH